MDFALLRMLVRRIMLSHRYRQILFYSVLVFLFILACSMWSDPGGVGKAERLSIEQKSDSGDLDETGSGDGNGFHYDGSSDYVTSDDPDTTEEGEGDHDGETTVRLDSGGPSHRFWPEDAKCSQHR